MKPAKGATKVVVVTSVMLSFVSFWRAAAIGLNDLGSSAYYGGQASMPARDHLQPEPLMRGGLDQPHRLIAEPNGGGQCHLSDLGTEESFAFPLENIQNLYGEPGDVPFLAVKETNCFIQSIPSAGKPSHKTLMWCFQARLNRTGAHNHVLALSHENGSGQQR